MVEFSPLGAQAHGPNGPNGLNNWEARPHQLCLGSIAGKGESRSRMAQHLTKCNKLKETQAIIKPQKPPCGVVTMTLPATDAVRVYRCTIEGVPY